ncbi:hypothetical protein AAG604_16175 [Citromicrobium bathyomarinum]|uniref:hypothetical protein n=1 Tax=Sphingomonadales TaxID=204457 RepID=UPI0006C8EC0D|nr:MULTISPECIES: hypothetical protein [Sphingomonadales]KPM20735.1 hypothetical protein AAJ72_15865 [Citromicrobium sp. RCC1885]KPM22725.1 hypothetical protein AAJ74_15870 [Citromicrobium sp. RCC1878]OAM06606.1 hypothetical protein A0U43_15825 [Citromicrobium sp. RCC1897]|tara:strand:+ start:1087 stop:2469 length:1383 start_codon:yes stop_codon:yes gene_type:complete
MLDRAQPTAAHRSPAARTGQVVLESLDSSAAVVICSLIFAWAIHQAHITILQPQWDYVGFSYAAPGLGTIAIMILLISIGSVAMPSRIERPSSMILLFLHVSVFIPGVTIALCLRIDSVQAYAPMLAVLTLVHVITGLVSRNGPAPPQGERFVPGPEVTLLLIGVWALVTLLIIYVFGEIMRFASLTEVYDQRFAVDRSTSIIGYIRSYYVNLICPALVAIGLLRRNVVVVGIGCVGCLIAYMVDAQKAALALPVLMIAMYYALRYAPNVAKLFTVPILFLAFLTLVCIVLRSTEVGFALQSVFFTRGIAIPSLTLVQYYDLFSTYGYTWWSNITGLSLVLPAPPAFANDPSWPALGQIVGDHYYGASINLNANANPYSGEGLAAGGLVGLLVIGVIMAAFLRVYDLCVAGWDRLFVLLIAVPVGFALSNAHLSTVLVSFGLAAWLLIFAFYKPGRGGWL